VSGVSIIDGWLPNVLLVVAVASAGATIWSQRRSWRRLRWPVLLTAIVVGASIAYFRRFDPLRYQFPWSFYVDLAAVVFVGTLAVVTWSRSRPIGRGVALLAAVATTLAGLNLVNIHYAYYPTMAALGGEVSPFEVSEARLGTMLETAATVGVLPRSGAVVRERIPASRSGFHARRALVYLPPVWFAANRPALPVLVLLPGTPSTPADWFRAGRADRVADAYARSHGGAAPILVAPDVNGSTFADTECVDGPLGNAETYITDDVTRFAVDSLGAAPDPAHWAVVGLSAGGTCAVTLALRHPERFSAFADFGGDSAPNVGDQGRTVATLYAGDASLLSTHDPSWLMSGRRYPDLKGWFEVGRGDQGPRRAAEQLADEAVDAGITTRLVERDGGHSYRFWHRAFAESFDWLCASVELPGASAS
jgi:S-formylglutathione hydrolase FrmB